jgi:microcystin-dependent protein
MAFDNRQATLAVTYTVQLTGIYPSVGGGSATEGYIGEIRTYAFADNVLLGNANGALVSTSANSALFSIIGTYYGGDGISNFALPDFGDVLGVGAATGQKTGADYVTITAANLPVSAGGSGVAMNNVEETLGVTWGIAVDGYYNGGSRPIGTVQAFAGNFVPAGYMKADGSLLDPATYGALFSIIGTTYGGDGITTFALPDLTNATPVGRSSTNPLGTESGSDSITLTQANLPVSEGGSGTGVDNRMPELALRPLIATSGLFPSYDSHGSSGTDETTLGEIIWWAGSGSLPSGYVEANGQLLSPLSNSSLFALLGTYYGGNGSTTFALPDLRDRGMVGTDHDRPLGSVYGSNTGTILAADTPDLGPTTGADALNGDGTENTVSFSASTLTSGDSYDGQGGSDTVRLTGGGTFNFTNTTFTSIESIQTDGSNSILDFSGFGSTEADREGLANLITSAAGANDVVKMGVWHQDLAILASMFGAGIETVEWTRTGGFDFSAVRNGSGQTVITSTDTGGNRSYASIDQTFDTNGILRESVTTYDDGRISDTVYDSAGNMTSQTITDPLNAVNYQSLVNNYSGGFLSSSVLTLDNGNTTTKTYGSGKLAQVVESDVSDSYNWDTKTTLYNISGTPISITTIYDAGEARSQMSFGYTSGILTSRQIINSDGSSSEASFNTSGVMQFTRNIASDGTQFILGGTGDNSLSGGTLDDVFKGGAGTDVFFFSGTVGNDTILDFTDGEDLLDISAYGYNTLADLQNANAISEVNGDTVIDLGADGSVTLKDFALSDFSDANMLNFGT